MVGATVGDGSAIGTISNDDSPVLTIADVSLAEGNGSTSTMGSSVDVGGCNSCHACAGEAGGKLTGP